MIHSSCATHRNQNHLGMLLASLILCWGVWTWIAPVAPAMAKATAPHTETCNQKETRLRKEFQAIMDNDTLTPQEVNIQSEAFKQRIDVLAACPPEHINRLADFMAKAAKKDLNKLNTEADKTPKKMDKALSPSH